MINTICPNIQEAGFSDIDIEFIIIPKKRYNIIVEEFEENLPQDEINSSVKVDTGMAV